MEPLTTHLQHICGATVYRSESRCVTKMRKGNVTVSTFSLKTITVPPHLTAPNMSDFTAVTMKMEKFLRLSQLETRRTEPSTMPFQHHSYSPSAFFFSSLRTVYWGRNHLKRFFNKEQKRMTIAKLAARSSVDVVQTRPLTHHTHLQKYRTAASESMSCRQTEPGRPPPRSQPVSRTLAPEQQMVVKWWPGITHPAEMYFLKKSPA